MTDRGVIRGLSADPMVREQLLIAHDAGHEEGCFKGWCVGWVAGILAPILLDLLRAL